MTVPTFVIPNRVFVSSQVAYYTGLARDAQNFGEELSSLSLPLLKPIVETTAGRVIYKSLASTVYLLFRFFIYDPAQAVVAGSQQLHGARKINDKVEGVISVSSGVIAFASIFFLLKMQIKINLKMPISPSIIGGGGEAVVGAEATSIVISRPPPAALSHIRMREAGEESGSSTEPIDPRAQKAIDEVLKRYAAGEYAKQQKVFGGNDFVPFNQSPDQATYLKTARDAMDAVRRNKWIEVKGDTVQITTAKGINPNDSGIRFLQLLQETFEENGFKVDWPNAPLRVKTTSPKTSPTQGTSLISGVVLGILKRVPIVGRFLQ